jgi:hypothetical protein
MELLTERYSKAISGILSSYDRVVLTGTIPVICYAQGMTLYLYNKGIRIFDYPKFAEPFKDKINENAKQLARDNGIEIEFVRKSSIRKEELVKKAIEKSGKTRGLVHIISAMEACPTYKPYHNKVTGKTYLKGDQSKCLHYYFYFIDETLGLVYCRVPTWCPFRLQIYFNGHNWLASELTAEGIKYTMIDNAFDSIEDFDKAQEISDNLVIEKLHKILDKFAETYCPVYKEFDQIYHWSVMQAEYATDIIFKKQEQLQSIYEKLISTAIHTVKPDNIATFLGQKIHGKYQGEMGNNYNIRVEGSRIKHTMGQVSIKMYDKFKKILRIETTTNNISYFKHYRMVEHRDGTSTYEQAGLKRNIYSLFPLMQILKSSNRRYLEFISAIEDDKAGKDNLSKISQKKVENNRSYKGFNFFDRLDLSLLLTIARGEFNISGFRSKNLKKYLPEKSSSQISRILKRLHVFGLIKKIRNCYKYYLTELGKTVILTGLKIKKLVIIPELNLLRVK